MSRSRIYRDTQVWRTDVATAIGVRYWYLDNELYEAKTSTTNVPPTPGQSDANYDLIPEVAWSNNPRNRQPDLSLSDFAVFRAVPRIGLLHKGLASFSPGSSYTAITNWNGSAGTLEFNADFGGIAPDPVTGIITCIEAGFYELTANLLFEQGNTNKELALLLWLRSSVNGDFVLSSLQVSDDKTPFRQLVAPGVPVEADAGETYQLGLSRINESVGSCTFAASSFFRLRQNLPDLTP